ncbi:MAG: glycosyltransferase [Phycisphaerae bacterium]
MSQPCFIFSGGGTGGHLFPGIAVANAVREKLPDARIIFLTTQRQLDRDLLGRTDFEQIEQPVRPMSSRPWHWPGFGLAWRSSVALAAKTIQKTQPTAILGLGGYAAAPPIVAGKKANVFTAILNPDAIPGKANRYLGRIADLVVAQWDVTRKHFSPATDVRVLGCPIRAEFESADPTIAMREFELVPTRPMLLVTGASQGARTVNDALIACWPKFFAKNPQWQLVHLTGTSEHERVQAAYERAESDLEDEKVDVARFRDSTRVVAFTHRMASVIAASSLVVSRAGASTLAELTRLGKPSVLFPYPYHKDRHQHANAQVLVERGAAVLLDDTRDGARNGAILAPVLEQVARKNVHDVMAECAALMGKPACAEKVAELLITRGG